MDPDQDAAAPKGSKLGTGPDDGGQQRPLSKRDFSDSSLLSKGGYPDEQEDQLKPLQAASKGLHHLSQPDPRKQARFQVANVSEANAGDDAKVADGMSPAHHQHHSGSNSGAVAESDDEDSTCQRTHGSHSQATYTNTTNFKSLRHYLTRDALPHENHYKNLMSFVNGTSKKRPTLDELHDEDENGQLLLHLGSPDPEAKGAEVVPHRAVEQQNLKGKVVKFGWLDGVYMRCLLNIWGVMLFLRLTWVVGQAGILQGIGIICLANLVTIITAISMSAVSTNGQIKGGGVYYMISRSLGPEFGGAIGIMFTLANSIAVAMYIIGFCDSLLDMMVEYFGTHGIFGDEGNRLNDVRLIGCITLLFVVGLVVVGMDWVTRVQMLLLALLLCSQADFIIGSFLPQEDEFKYGFVGYNFTQMKKNLYSNYHDYEQPNNKPSFFSVFGVFFPAVTGIVAGANLSGDLKDPATAIPKGTLLAIFTTFMTYLVYGVIVTAVTVPDASGNQTEFEVWRYGNVSDDVLSFTNCSLEVRGDQICKYGSANDQQNMAKISFTGYLIYTGCFAATLSSAIASLVGAPRVLQALGKDKLYPAVGFFSQGYGANNDPFRGYILVFFIAMACIAIGQLDVVSTLLSNFFVAAYALINFSVFHASITKSPGWRPSFKYYNQWVSLAGTALCVSVMFLMDWKTALITFACVAILYFYISYRKPEANWGSSTQAQHFITTLKNVQTLNEVQDHVKNYRPKVLVLSGIPAHRQPLVDFGYLITKKLSLMICADVELGEGAEKQLAALKRSVYTWLKDQDIKAFFAACSDRSFARGAISCVDLVGIGKLTPNMVLIGFKSNWQTEGASLQDYMDVIHHVFDVRLAVGILRLSRGCDFSNLIGKKPQPLTAAAVVTDRGDPGEAEGSKNEEDQGNGQDDDEPENGKEYAEASPAEQSGNDQSTTSSVDQASGQKPPAALYYGVDGKPLSKDIVSHITQFQSKNRKGTIDVWWLYDDGGLTLLLPYILTTRSQFSDCSLRVFALANRRDELDRETRNMVSLLAKFRIDYSDVTIIPDVTKKAQDATVGEFNQILDGIAHQKPSEDDLLAHRVTTNRHLRLAELLREHSTNSEMVIMTLPIPRRGAAPHALYMSWLEVMTRQMPPFLLLRGNQTSVLTFYS